MRANTIYNIPIEKIQPYTHAPRKSFDNYELGRLCESIRVNGITEPLITLREGNGYKIVSGVRRYKAAETLGLSTLPCRVLTQADKPWLIPFTDSNTAKPLGYFEQAEGISKLLDAGWLTTTEAAEMLGLTQKGLCDFLKILTFQAEERKRILRGGLELRHMKTLLRIHDELTRAKVLDTIVARGMTPTESERYVEQLINPPTQEKREIPQNTALFFDKRVLENTLQGVVSTAQKAGLRLEYTKTENENSYEYSLKIQKEAANTNGGSYLISAHKTAK